MDIQLNQVATYWGPAGEDLYGRTLFDAPIQIACRWEENAEEIRTKTGDTKVSKSRVFLSQEVDHDGYLFRGTSVETNPVIVDGADEIIQISEVPDLAAMTQLVVAYL